MMSGIVRALPVVLTAVGVGIHFFGALGVFQQDVPFLNHAVMLAINTLVVIGLLLRASWGYWLAVALYTQQSMLQPYWAWQNYFQTGQIVLLVVPLLCWMSLTILLSRRSAKRLW